MDKVKVAVTTPVTKITGFMEFVREQGVIGLAVGLAIGAQAAELVKIIVGSLITPIIDLLVGPGGLSALKWTVQVADRTGTFTFGTLLDTLIRFLAVLAVIYFVIKGLGFDKLDKKKDDATKVEVEIPKKPGSAKAAKVTKTTATKTSKK
jgi:large conductance mechanosensitive channel